MHNITLKISSIFLNKFNLKDKTIKNVQRKDKPAVNRMDSPKRRISKSEV